MCAMKASASPRSLFATILSWSAPDAAGKEPGDLIRESRRLSAVLFGSDRCCGIRGGSSRLHVLAIAALSMAAACLPALSQDTLILTNGQRRDVEIVRVNADRIVFKSGPAETSLPLDQVASVKMSPPKKFLEAIELRRGPEPQKALPVLQSLVEQFGRLPAPWAERASAMLGDALLDSGDAAGAEAAFADFQTSYPNAQALADLGLARLALEKRDFQTAEAKAGPMVEVARQTLFAETGKSSEFGQACLIMGTVLEEQGKLPEALQTYLLATTVFYEDQAVAAKAQARADVLSKEKNVTVP